MFYIQIRDKYNAADILPKLLNKCIRYWVKFHRIFSQLAEELLATNFFIYLQKKIINT